MYYPEGMKARVSPVQSIEPHRILAPTLDLNREPLGPQSQSSNHYTTAAHTREAGPTGFVVVETILFCGGNFSFLSGSRFLFARQVLLIFFQTFSVFNHL